MAHRGTAGPQLTSPAEPPGTRTAPPLGRLSRPRPPQVPAFRPRHSDQGAERAALPNPKCSRCLVAQPVVVRRSNCPESALPRFAAVNLAATDHASPWCRRGPTNLRSRICSRRQRLGLTAPDGRRDLPNLLLFGHCVAGRNQRRDSGGCANHGTRRRRNRRTVAVGGRDEEAVVDARRRACHNAGGGT